MYTTSKVSSSEENEAPTHDEVDINQKIQLGWRLAQEQNNRTPISKVGSKKQTFGIRSTALGLSTSGTYSEAPDISKKIDDGWKRSLTGNPQREKFRAPKKGAIRSAVTGISNSISNQESSDASLEIQQKAQDAMKRAEKMKGIAPTAEAKSHRRNKNGIRSAAIGITNLDKEHSSDDEFDEMTEKLNMAMSRTEKNSTPNRDVRSHRHSIRSSIVNSTNATEPDKAIEEPFYFTNDSSHEAKALKKRESFSSPPQFGKTQSIGNEYVTKSPVGRPQVKYQRRGSVLMSAVTGRAI